MAFRRGTSFFKGGIRGESHVVALGSADTNDPSRIRKGLRVNTVSDPSPKHRLTHLSLLFLFERISAHLNKA
jgi:hypothetical protein